MKLAKIRHLCNSKQCVSLPLTLILHTGIERKQKWSHVPVSSLVIQVTAAVSFSEKQTLIPQLFYIIMVCIFALCLFSQFSHSTCCSWSCAVSFQCCLWVPNECSTFSLFMRVLWSENSRNALISCETNVTTVKPMENFFRQGNKEHKSLSTGFSVH